jgi:hypothetical protein
MESIAFEKEAAQADRIGDQEQVDKPSEPG